MINIVRDPRWGRNIESAGEDPFVSGQYAANFVQGFEHADETPYPLQASACCKHFVVRLERPCSGRLSQCYSLYLAAFLPPPPPSPRTLSAFTCTAPSSFHR